MRLFKNCRRNQVISLDAIPYDAYMKEKQFCSRIWWQKFLAYFFEKVRILEATFIVRIGINHIEPRGWVLNWLGWVLSLANGRQFEFCSSHDEKSCECLKTRGVWINSSIWKNERIQLHVKLRAIKLMELMNSGSFIISLNYMTSWIYRLKQRTKKKKTEERKNGHIINYNMI